MVRRSRWGDCRCVVINISNVFEIQIINMREEIKDLTKLFQIFREIPWNNHKFVVK